MIGFEKINVGNVMEGTATTVTLIRPNGAGVEISINPDALPTAQDLINQAELSLNLGSRYSFTVTRSGEVLKVKDITDFLIQPGDELAVTSENRGG